MVADRRPDPTICVFHLVWAPLGLDRFAQFLASYRQHQAGVPHRLHILFNGFETDDAIQPYRDLLADSDVDSTIIPRPVQDINAYLVGARSVAAEYLCFLNSYSIILHDQWLAYLCHHAQHGSVGLVGATGSYESYLTAFLLMTAPEPLRLGRNPSRWLRDLLRWGKRRLRRRIFHPRYAGQYEPFPNPHLRTNAFLVRRDLLLSFDFGPIRSKGDALRFESGKRSLSQRILQSGRDVLLVGADGKAYPIAEWPVSGTFRSGDQANLLVADNRTRDYLAAPPEHRRLLTAFAWGDPREMIGSCPP